MIDSQLSVDPHTKHIISAILFNSSGRVSERPSISIASVETLSPVSGVYCDLFYLNSEKTSKLPADITEGDRKYLYVNNEIFLCPKLVIDVPGYSPNRLPLNTDIEVVISYIESRGVSFLNAIKELKFKDRFQFIDVPKRIRFDKESSTATVTIRSSFPGVSMLRAKDTDYLCFFEPLEVRFRQ